MSARVARRTVALGLLLAALPSAARAQDPPPLVAPGVVAAGVDLSGLTAQQAAARLQEQLASRLAAPVVVRVAGRRFELGSGRSQLQLDATATALAALAAEPPAPGLEGGGVPLVLRHSASAVRAFAADVAVHVRRSPRNATLRIGLKRMQVRRAVVGLRVDAGALATRIDAMLDGDPRLSRLVALRARKVYPPVNANDLRRMYPTVLTVSKSELRLRLFKRLKWVKTYRVAIGQPAYPTPSGRFRITSKQVNPVWSVPNSPWAGELGGSTVPGGSPANPLKARWMGIVDGVGIHGTGADWSIGTRASHGCIRMHVGDVVELYPRVPIGTPIVIR